MDDFISQKNQIPDYEFLFRKSGSKSLNSTNFLGRLLKINFWKILLSLVLYIIKASPVFIVPILTANIINIAANPNPAAYKMQLVYYSIAIAVIILQNIPMHILSARVSDKLTRSVSAGLKRTLVVKLQRLSITYHKEMESGKIQSKFLRDIESIDGLFSSLVKTIIPTVLMTLISIGISLYKSGLVTLFFVFAVPLNLFFAFLFRKQISGNSRKYRMENESLSASLTKMLDMLMITKAHGLEQEEIAAMQNKIKNVMKRGLDADRTVASFGSALWVFGNLLSAACLVFCAYLAITGKIGVGDIVLYQTLFVSINGNVQMLVNSLPMISSGFEAVRSVSEVMQSEDLEINSEAKLNPLVGDIKFENVSYRYNKGSDYVVKNFSLHVKAGQCVALVGASGSGKSTILNMIIGFLNITEGRLLIDDKPISSLNITDYRKNLSVVPQNSILFAGTVRENITYGMAGYSENDLQKVIEIANINEFLKDMPNGVDTNIGEHGGLLSGGQRQRITIARAMIRDPKILILDEATSALDNISEFQVQKAITESIKERTTFIVAHRLSTIRNADFIVVMKEGECVESGTYQELMDLKGEFFKLKKLSEI